MPRVLRRPVINLSPTTGVKRPNLVCACARRNGIAIEPAAQ